MEIDLELSTIFDYPLVEGKCVPDNLPDIAQDIINRREEIFPGSTTESNYNYIEGDWKGYHDYVCIEKFPQLKFMLECIGKALDMIGEDYKQYYFKSWINIWSKGQTINPHKHYGEWHGNYVIQDTGTETYYASQQEVQGREIVPLQNFDGHFVMMPGHIWHWGQKNQEDKLRVSSAFNLSTWDQVLQEEKDNVLDRGSKIKHIVLPLKDYL